MSKSLRNIWNKSTSLNVKIQRMFSFQIDLDCGLHFATLLPISVHPLVLLQHRHLLFSRISGHIHGSLPLGPVHVFPIVHLRHSSSCNPPWRISIQNLNSFFLFWGIVYLALRVSKVSHWPLSQRLLSWLLIGDQMILQASRKVLYPDVDDPLGTLTKSQCSNWKLVLTTLK